jgi:U3 small nucleolar RNA-associated protein 20
MAHLQKEMGTTEYIQVYQSVHEEVIQKRRDRKTQKAIMAVQDPKMRAAEKQKKTALKVKARKRKAEEFANKKIKYSHSIKSKAERI